MIGKNYIFRSIHRPPLLALASWRTYIAGIALTSRIVKLVILVISSPSAARSCIQLNRQRATSTTDKMSRRQPQFNQHLLVDTTPMPDDIPKVQEIGATSAPLMSASFFIGDRCQAYNDDYMKCKEEANGRGELECLKEGRKVTRCAASVIKDINTHCLKQFNAHWECLENNNHHLFECRKPEMELNSCVFDKLGLKKVIPGTPEGQTPVHLRPKQLYAQYPGAQY